MTEENPAFDVLFHSGYRGREMPRAIIIGGETYPVKEIMGIQRIQHHLTGERSEIFKCRLASAIRDNCCTIEIRVFEHHRFEIKFLD
jgi:hypothetical protein